LPRADDSARVLPHVADVAKSDGGHDMLVFLARAIVRLSATHLYKHSCAAGAAPAR